VAEGERIGVVGRNGDGKSTLISLLARQTEPDSGRVTHNRDLRLGVLAQRDEFPGGATVRGLVFGDRPEHEWAGDARARDILAGLLPGLELDAPVEGDVGRRARRVGLARLLVPESDLLVLDEPTNHLDLEAIAWLGPAPAGPAGRLIVVTHDRWFLDEVTDTVLGGRRPPRCIATTAATRRTSWPSRAGPDRRGHRGEAAEPAA